ncbi:hypothetical protein GS445_01955 [Rhodococcus hoagii]|uniref:hypothetical protein n=1 Tax=Rhodococcus hoagii TaxID=43767 RepID=UPI00197D5BE3|nr:hypothetical protein [Prescottella equi]MBM4548521.1 hypothetical protein [Prescottella equi]MBM4710889.1 hypothetical protein [Prescottella equi]MBP0086117.1 hypothetical protein [Prescottella equi]NKT29915.1 hypothetical protein [Prescottella equi]NKT99619.1 hypothetical protein [Prescottella equi]
MTKYPVTTVPKLASEKALKHRRMKFAQAGVPTLVDSAPIRAHIDELLGMGMSAMMIARRAGVGDRTIRKIRSGEYAKTQFLVAQRIMAADHMPAPHMSFVMPVGAVRRVRALQAFGWTLTDIGARIGMAETNIAALQHQRRVSYSLWMRIREVYEELSSTPGPSDDSRRRASRKGWLNPFEWEGYDIDDPRVTPPRSARTTADRSGARADRLEQVADLTAQGLSAGAIADQLGVSERQIQRDRSAA